MTRIERFTTHYSTLRWNMWTPRCLIHLNPFPILVGCRPWNQIFFQDFITISGHFRTKIGHEMAWSDGTMGCPSRQPVGQILRATQAGHPRARSSRGWKWCRNSTWRRGQGPGKTKKQRTRQEQKSRLVSDFSGVWCISFIIVYLLPIVHIYVYIYIII